MELFETAYKGVLRIVKRFHKNHNQNSVNKIHRFWMILQSKVMLQVGLWKYF
jgi:hypothetical protein